MLRIILCFALVHIVCGRIMYETPILNFQEEENATQIQEGYYFCNVNGYCNHLTIDKRTFLAYYMQRLNML